MQACLLGEEDVQGVLVMCTYLTRLLSNLSSNRTLFSYVPEVTQHLPPPFDAEPDLLVLRTHSVFEVHHQRVHLGLCVLC